MLSIVGRIYEEYVQKEKCRKTLFISKGEISAALKGTTWTTAEVLHIVLVTCVWSIWTETETEKQPPNKPSLLKRKKIVDTK